MRRPSSGATRSHVFAPAFSHFVTLATLATFATGAVATLAGCPAEPPALELAPPELGPLAAGDFLIQGDVANESLVVMASDHGRLESLRRIALSGPPSRIAPVPGQSAALVLSRYAETLDVVDLAGGDRRALVLGAPFEAVAISDDAKEALAYFPPGTATTVFYNDNEVAQIDLDPGTPPAAAVTRRTLASLGGAPIAIALSPLVGDRRYAFVLSQEHVAVVNLDDPDMTERSVPLVSLTTGGHRTPRAVDFAVDRTSGVDQLWALVTTQESSSVYALEIVPATDPGTEEGAPDFDVRLSQLSGIGPGGSAALLALADGRLASLTTAPATGQLTLTDLATATGQSVGLPGGVSSIRLFTAPPAGAPADAAPTLQAVAWSPGASQFHVVDIEALAEGSDKAFRTRSTREPFTSLLPVPGTALFVMFHASSDKAVSVLDAATDRVTSFGRTGDVLAAELVPELGRLFLLTGLGGRSYIVSVDLATLHPETAEVPDAATGLAVLSGVQTVAAFSQSAEGHVVLWPAGDTRPGATQAIPGYLLDGLFQRQEP
ncbi:MAG: hypothetical protein U1F43_33240 [Myxococcota bacterium]